MFPAECCHHPDNVAVDTLDTGPDETMITFTFPRVILTNIHASQNFRMLKCDIKNKVQWNKSRNNENNELE